MFNKFNDSNFIPDAQFCETIDENSPLIILKGSSDGRICNFYLGNEETNYFELIQKSNNKFLKLVYFKCLESTVSVEEQKRILNSEGLIPLFNEVALNIVKQRIRKYRPMWMVKDYIKRAHPTIPNSDLFIDVGNILTHIINDENKTHIKDVFYILKDFLGLKKKILKSAKIPDSIFDAIDYWINSIFDGKLTIYSITKHLLEKIIEFYENLDLKIDENSKREIFYRIKTVSMQYFIFSFKRVY